jgi:predicted ATPase
VTFLFTDVEGSTRLWQVDREAMASALALHDAIVQGAVESHRGYVFSTAGDSFGAAFWTPDEALAAADSTQATLAEVVWPEPIVIRVRMGVHTGTATERAGDYFGPTLNLAARIADAGHGGQVLVSDATARLVSGRPLRRLGEHRLKDVVGPEVLWQVGDAEFPALRTRSERGGNLPRATRSFVGQVEDLKRLVAAVGVGSVVTLTGVGGVGKTRLALEAATTLRTEFADGAWWCDLAALEDPGSLVGAVAATLSIAMQAGLTPTDSVVDWLSGRSLLVVLDNCEHLLDAAAELVDAVLAACPSISVLATSREPLGLDGEQVWPVRSLDPDLEGVQLFLERAIAADASFTPGDDRAVLVELCRHLDGIPLAIELAAAKVRAMSPNEVLDRLGDRFRLLRGGARGGMDRHRTLTATLDWSYGQLPPDQRQLLDRLCVFAGNFDLAAVKEVCMTEVVDDIDVLDAMTSLVDKSMVVAERHSLGTRYRLLETVRQYGEGHAATMGELADLRVRHLQYYLGVVEAAAAAWFHDYIRGKEVFDREWDNIRAATQTALANSDSHALGRIFTGIGTPAVQGLRWEVGDWADAAIELDDAHVAAFGTAAVFSGIFGDYERCEALARAGMSVASDASYDELLTCRTALYIGLARSGQMDLALEVLRAVQRAAMEVGDPYGDALSSSTYALRALATDPAGVAAYAQRSETLIAAYRHAVLRSEVLGNLSRYYALVGDASRGIDYCRENIALAEEHQLPRGVHHARNALAQLLMRTETEDPIPALREAISGASHARSWYDLWPTMLILAEYWMTRNQPDAAAVLVGYLDSHHLITVNDTTRELLGSSPDVRLAQEQGARLDRDQLVAFVLEHLPDESVGTPTPD